MQVVDDGKHPEDLLPPGTPGSLLWCPHDVFGFGVRRVISSDGETVDVEPVGGYGDEDDGQFDAGMETYAMADTHPFDPTHRRNLDNLSDMDNLHVAPLLGLLRRRYMADSIYTLTATVKTASTEPCIVSARLD